MLTLGAAVERERVRNRGSFGAFAAPETDLARTNRAAYLQALGERGVIAVQGGLRLDDNQRFGRFVTWRAGTSVRMAPATRLRASAGTAFKEPTFDENYSTAFSTGNPDLRPERSTSLEVGLEQSLAAGRATASLTLFAQRFRDLIQYHFSPNPADTNFFNVASAVASGAEVELRAEASRSITLSAQYTWLHTSAADSGFDGAVFAKGQRLLRRPTHSGSVSAEWHATLAAAGARLLYVGDRTDLDFSQFPAPRVTLKPYGRLDLWGHVTLARARNGRGSLALTARVDNVANVAYEEIRGFAAPGRRILVGGRIEVR
jgi:vitamin B12 transporter